MTQNRTSSLLVRLLKTLTLKLSKPILLSILAISSVNAFADVCPNQTTESRLTSVSFRGGDLIKSDYVTCNYFNDLNSRYPGPYSITIGQASDPLKITPSVESEWPEYGDRRICDALKGFECEFNVQSRGKIDYTTALYRVRDFDRALSDFVVSFTLAVEPSEDRTMVVVDFAQVEKPINSILEKFGKLTDGAVSEAGKLFTFAGTDAEARAKAMIGYLNVGTDSSLPPVVSVNKNSDGTYSVGMDVAPPFNEILSSLKAKESPNGKVYLNPQEWNDLQQVIDVNRQRFEGVFLNLYELVPN